MVDASYLIDIQRFADVHEDHVTLVFKDKPRALRVTQDDIQVVEGKAESNGTRRINFMTVYGLIQLRAGSYLILVTKAQLLGQIMQRQILKPERFEFVPVGRKGVAPVDQPYVQALQTLFDTRTFYYSENYNLTCSLQEQFEEKKRYSQFFLNEHLAEPFAKANVSDYVPVFISGLVMIKYAKADSVDCDLVLISRRDKRRMGRRFISRGADTQGYCSNYAETEQIFTFYHDGEQYIYSFLQTRGSMPFKWSQKPNLKWAPRGQVSGSLDDNVKICQAHFDDCSYKKQVLVNLIDKKGNQLLLGDYYQKLVSQLNNSELRYLWFDFHHECRGMQYDNLSKLVAQVQSELGSYGQFLMRGKQVVQKQNGVLRTNCIDCLDRTNVVQSVFARQVLWQALRQVGVNKRGSEPFEKFPGTLENVFREIWTKNADVMSTLYTGTGALKTDFTKTGKRTKQGALQDGRNSIVRYFLNNFYDHQNQNAIDLLVGRLDVKQHVIKNEVNPLIFLIVLLTLIPVISYFIATHLHNDDLQTNPSPLSQESNSSLKFQATLTGLTITGLFLTAKLVQKAYKLFVRKPFIEH